mgnify:CR=1 FL=1
MAKKQKDWTSGRTCVYNIGYHIVWTTKYRRKVITGNIEETLKGFFEAIAQTNDFEIKEMELMDDHCHLFISCHPKHSPSSMVKKLKGITARKLFTQYPELKKTLWGGHLWNPSYYIGTVGDMSKDVVLRYIQNQKAEA